MENLKNIEQLVNMADALTKEHPEDARLKVLLLSLKEVKTEFSKSYLDQIKIKQLSYGVTRVFQDMLEFERTPFGEEIGKLLIELNKLGYS
jgi:hypothetical protein